MRKLLIALTVLILAACGGNQPTEVPSEEVVEIAMAFYGDSIVADDAITSETFLMKMEGQDSLPVKLSATINQTCRMKGCWMTLDMGNDEEMRVSFKDYGFFVPTEGVDGKTVIVEGYAYTDTVSVEMLQHLAEDAGKSEDEIAAITEPETGVSFEANGVIIMD